MHVRVVNAKLPASDLASVNLVINVDLPTDGNPTSATEASPDFLTSKPLAGPAAFAEAAAFSSLSFNCAIFALSLPM